MNENESKKQTWLPIVGGVVLIVVLFIAIKLIFAGLEQVIPKQTAGDSSQPPAQSQTVEDVSETKGPRFCPFCGEELNDSFQWGQYCPFCGEKVEE